MLNYLDIVLMSHITQIKDQFMLCTALPGSPSNLSSRQPLAVHIRVVYMSLYCSAACSLPFCSQWPACPFNTYLRLHISSFNYWLTARQYWTLHYRISSMTSHHSLSGQSDTQCLGQQRSVTLNLSASQVIVQRGQWPWLTAYIMYWSSRLCQGHANHQ